MPAKRRAPPTGRGPRADEGPERKIAYAVYRAAEEREAAAARAFGVS